jgi:hypothetical protein
MRKFSFCLTMAMSLLMLAACGKPPVSQAENDRIDEAMARVKIEQDRTDQAEVLKQAGAAAEGREERSVYATPVRQIHPNTPAQHFPANIRPQLPPGSDRSAGSGK